MRLTRIFYQGELIPNGVVTLIDGAAHHIIHVLRHKVGYKLILFNDSGYDFEGRIIDIKKNKATIEVLDTKLVSNESPLALHLGQVISKSDRMDYALQKACELGVTEISPLFSSYGGIKLDENRREKKMSHWQQIIKSACEQSGRAVLPKLYEPQSLKTWLLQPHQDTGLIFHPEASSRLSQITLSGSIRLVIGPEGGFSEEEISLSHQHNYQNVQLGRRILRTETATVTALSCLQLLRGDFTHEH